MFCQGTKGATLELINANSTRHTELNNPTYSRNTTVYPDQLNHSDFSTSNSTVTMETSTSTFHSCQSPPRNPVRQNFTQVNLQWNPKSTVHLAPWPAQIKEFQYERRPVEAMAKERMDYGTGNNVPTCSQEQNFYHY